MISELFIPDANRWIWI